MLEIQAYIVLFLLWFISTLFIRSIFTKSTKTLKVLIYNLALQFACHLLDNGHIPYLRSLLHQALYKLSTRYVPLIHLMLGPTHVVVASSAEMAKHFISILNCSCGCIYWDCRKLRKNTTDYGDYWRFLKKLCLTELLSGKTLEHFVSIRQDEIECFWKNILQISNTGNIISRMTMGKKSLGSTAEVGKLRKVVREIGELLGSFNMGDIFAFMNPLDLQGLGKKIMGTHHLMDAMIEKVSKEHEVARSKEGDDNDRQKDLF